jgi:cysteine desulfurase
MDRIYLDNNSTTPMLPEVVEAMRPFFATTFGNPASAHRSGAAARTALEDARFTVAQCLEAYAEEVVFTSGATEANNLALFGLPDQEPGEVVTSPIEHPSVAEPIRQLEAWGHHLQVLGVDGQGRVAADELHQLIADNTRLISIQLANHETGTVQDIKTLAAQAPGVFFHTDATQAVGKMAVSFRELGVSTLACSGHKLYGPKGVGVILVKRGVRLRPRLLGGHQQQGLRPGTEPVALAVGLAAALRLAVDQQKQRHDQVVQLRQRFLDELRPAEPWVINGAPDGMPHTVNVSFPGCAADVLLIRLDLAGIDCSTGSACSSGSLLPSPVLQALGCPPDILKSAMRFSLSHLVTEAQVTEAARRIVREVRALRGNHPASSLV